MKQPRISTLQGIYTQANSILGVSIITYPFTYAKLGFVLSTLFTIFMCICSAFTLYFLTKSAKTTEKEDVDELVEHVLGKTAKFFVTMVLYSACLLPLVFYLDVSSDFYNDFLMYFNITSHRNYIACAVTLFVIILCFVCRDVRHLQFVSVAALVSLISFILYVIVDFFMQLNKISFSGLKKWELNYDSLSSVSFIIFAFISHSSIISIMDCVEPLSSCRTVIVAANVIAALFYILTGFMGSAAHPDCEQKYLMNPGFSEPIKVTLKAFLGTVNVLSFPLMMIPARHNLSYFFNFAVNVKSSLLYENLLTIFNSLLTLLIVVLMSKMDFLENLFFIIGALTMFVIPVVLFWKTEKEMGWVHRVFCWLSVPLSVFSIFMGVKGFIEMGYKE